MFTSWDSKGMEMWQLVLIVLALLLFFAMLIWFGALNKDLGGLLDAFGNLF